MSAAHHLEADDHAIPSGEIEKIVDLTLDTYEVEARKTTHAYAAAKAYTGHSGAGGMAATAGAAITVAPAILPIALLAGGAWAMHQFTINNNTEQDELERLRNNTRSDVHNTVKKSLLNIVRDIVTDYFDKLSKPKTRTYSGKLEGKASDIKPIEFCSAESISSAFKDHCEQEGLDTKTADALSDFLRRRLPEGIKVLQATQALRAELRLTPKPPVAWGKRNKLPAGNKTLGEALGEYYPNHPARDQRLNELDYTDWWSAFYEEDAKSGKINTSHLKDNDHAFYLTLKKKENEFIPVFQLFKVPDFVERSKYLGDILGDESSLKRIKGMFVKGNTVSPER